MPEIMGKHAELSIESPELLLRIAKALSSPVRLEALKALGARSMSVGELAKALDVPMSTMALAIRTLEDAELVRSDMQPGSHGALKICSRKLDTIAVNLVPRDQQIGAQPLCLSMPIGGYSMAEGIQPTCGLLSEIAPLGPMDLPRVFYSPQRFDAQLIWFKQGYLEYRFCETLLTEDTIDWMELSFEACSEAPMYRDPWPSDIFVDFNGIRLGTWTCPCDCGGRQGHLTPAWWGLTNTQYGFLKTWRIDRTGTYLDHAPLSDVTISDLNINGMPYASVRIGVDSASENVNGINLFGDKFGDHPQSITLRIGYAL